MRSKRELMREMLENAVIESAKPNYKFSYNCSTETNYKWVRIEDSWFSCVRRLKDKDNFCTKEDRYPLSAIDKVLDFIFLEEELEESELISLIGKEQIEKEANVKMLNSLLKDIEKKRKEISEDLQKHKLCDNRLLYSGQLKGYNVLKNHIIQIKKNL